MDHLDDQAAADASQDAAERRDLDVFAQATAAADARLSGEPAASEPQDEPPTDDEYSAPERPEQQDQSTASAQHAADQDLFADASPEQRAYLQSLIADRDREAQAARSANGRYAAAQRQLADRERQFNEQIATIRHADNNGDGQGAQRQLNALDERIAAMREDYPDMAEHMQGVADALRSEISQDLEPVNQLRQREAERQREEVLNIETGELVRRHPDAEQVVREQAFADWLTSQSDTVQRLASSEAAADADVVLTLYKSTKLQAQTQRNAQRQRKLADMAPLSGSQGRAVSDTSDEQTLFSRASASADQRLTQRKY